MNSLIYSGRVGFFSNAAASTTFWMTPNSSFSSAWLGFTPVVAGIFGPNANNLAHTFKQFRIRKLRVQIPPMTGINQIVAYTQQVGYVTTSLSFPGIMDYPAAIYSGLGQTTPMYLNVSKSILRSTTSPWFSTEDNPGTSSTDPASDPNLSSHGLLIVTDGAAAGYPYILYFTIEFRNPENSAQIGPSPFLKFTQDDVAFIRKMRGLTVTDTAKSNETQQKRITSPSDNKDITGQLNV